MAAGMRILRDEFSDRADQRVEPTYSEDASATEVKEIQAETRIVIKTIAATLHRRLLRILEYNQKFGP